MRPHQWTCAVPAGTIPGSEVQVLLNPALAHIRTAIRGSPLAKDTGWSVTSPLLMTLQALNPDKDRLVGMDILNSGETNTKRGAGDVSTELPVFGPFN